MLNSLLYCCCGQETFNENPKLGVSKGLNIKGDSNYYIVFGQHYNNYLIVFLLSGDL